MKKNFLISIICILIIIIVVLMSYIIIVIPSNKEKSNCNLNQQTNGEKNKIESNFDLGEAEKRIYLLVMREILVLDLHINILML